MARLLSAGTRRPRAPAYAQRERRPRGIGHDEAVAAFADDPRPPPRNGTVLRGLGGLGVDLVELADLELERAALDHEHLAVAERLPAAAPTARGDDDRIRGHAVLEAVVVRALAALALAAGAEAVHRDELAVGHEHGVQGGVLEPPVRDGRRRRRQRIGRVHLSGAI